MTKEEKQLLFKDLCGRLPYGVMVHFCHTNIDEKLIEISLGEKIAYLRENGKGNQGEVIPFLRPMSSMTEIEKIEWKKASNNEDGFVFANEAHLSVDWLNENMFDYRGLIPMGLALEAPEGMY